MKPAEAELCQAQVKLEVIFEVELDVGVEVVVEGCSLVYFFGWTDG